MGKKMLAIMLLCAAIATTFGLTSSVDFFAVGNAVLKPVASLADKAMDVVEFLLPNEKADDPYNTQFYVPQSMEDTIYLYRVYFGENNEYYVDFNCIENEIRPIKRDWYVLYTNYEGEWHMLEHGLPSDIKFSYEPYIVNRDDVSIEYWHYFDRYFVFYPVIKPRDFNYKSMTYSDYLTIYYDNGMTQQEFQAFLKER